MLDKDILMSKQFEDFSLTVRTLYRERAAKEKYFKEASAIYMADIMKIDQRLNEATADFEQWVKDRQLNCGDG